MRTVIRIQLFLFLSLTTTAAVIADFDISCRDDFNDLTGVIDRVLDLQLDDQANLDQTVLHIQQSFRSAQTNG